MGETVAVIGGSGFLGRHVVRLLQEEALSTEKGCLQIKEIRVLDIRDFYSNLEIEWEIGDGRKLYLKDDYECSSGSPTLRTRGSDVDSLKPVYHRVNICDHSALVEALKDVSMVVNCSAVLPDLYHEDFGDKRLMEQVNVQGVSTIVSACKEVQVRTLVHVSTTMALMGPKRFIDHTESSTPMVPENQLHLKHYAIGRLRADQIVMEANNTGNAGGPLLRTVVLRLPLAYGEGDSRFIPRLVHIAHVCGGELPWIGSAEEVHQMIYIGNAAWATILGLRALKGSSSNSSDLQDVGGNNVYITDDSMFWTLPISVAPFLEPLGITQQPASEWFWLNRFIAAVYGLLSKYGAMTLHHPLESTLTPAIMHVLTGHTYVVCRMRATLGLNYAPKYSPEESKKRSNNFYSKIIVK